MCWLGLELNTLGFIPFILKDNSKGLRESRVKYFLTQAFASSILLLGILSASNSLGSWAERINLFVLLALFVKLGVAPFHGWVPRIAEPLHWWVLFILLTVQKVNPLIIFLSQTWILKFIFIGVCFSVLVGGIGGICEVRLRKILVFSSISHMGWVLATLFLSTRLIVLYFVSYSLLLAAVVAVICKLNLQHLVQMSSRNLSVGWGAAVFTNLLSLGGLPPFFGFLPKWMVLEMLVLEGLYLLVIFIIFSSLLVLYYYLRIAFSRFILKKINWTFEEVLYLGTCSTSLSLFSLGGLTVSFLF